MAAAVGLKPSIECSARIEPETDRLVVDPGHQHNIFNYFCALGHNSYAHMFKIMCTMSETRRVQ